MAQFYEIVLDQGATSEQELNLFNEDDTPVDLFGYTARMQVRSSPSSSKVVDELTTENGRIKIVGGTITLYWPAKTTSEIRAGGYRYDIEIESADGNVERILEGAFIVRREVTR